jgi:type IV secretory pathway VirB6-like protein
MMSQVKRINLSFDLINEKLREAYEIIISKRSAKTAFVADAVLAYIENNTQINKQCIKDAVKEAIQEMGGITVNEANNEESAGGIPDDVFDIISQI